MLETNHLQCETESNKTEGLWSAVHASVSHATTDEEHKSAQKEFDGHQSRIDEVLDRLALIGHAYNSTIRQVQEICLVESFFLIQTPWFRMSWTAPRFLLHLTAFLRYLPV